MRLDTPTTPGAPTSPASAAGFRQAFRQAFRHHPSGVAVITGDDGTGPVAMTVSSVFSVSLEPPLLGFSASTSSSSTACLRRAETLVVHLIAPDEVWLPKLAATPGVDRFADVEWDRLPTGEPYYPGIRTWLRGRTHTSVEVDGASVLVVEVVGLCADPADRASETGALVYFDRGWHRLGSHTLLD